MLAARKTFPCVHLDLLRTKVPKRGFRREIGTAQLKGEKGKEGKERTRK